MPRRHPILISRIGLAVVFGCAALSAACGQKGPLYRPGEKAQQVTPTSDTQTGKKKSEPFVPAPQSQKKDRPAENPQPADTTTATPVATPPVDSDRPATVPPSQPQPPGKE